mgnify:CR=1 FL=1|tara:strand:+ start:38402 stop:40819 length:2418 start_codon:yes stop_codon:yes gene_type:complete
MSKISPLPPLRYTALAIAIASPISVIAADVAERRVLEEVIVTAQKREQNLQDVPISLNAIGQDKLYELAINEIVDIARIEPSLRYQSSALPFAKGFGMRGITSFTVQGGVQPSVAMIVDGVPLARAGEFVSELGDIAQIEVLRGPQGTLYGKNATGGLINVRRHKPSDEFAGEVKVSVTDDNEILTSGMINAPINDKIRSRFTAFYKDREGHLDNVAPGVANDGYEIYRGIMGKLAIDFNENIDLLLTAEYRKGKDGNGAQVTTKSITPSRTAAIGQNVIDDPFKINQDRQTSIDIENQAISGELTWALNDSMVLKSITGVRDWKSGVDNDIDGSPATPTNPMGVGFIHIPRSNLNPNPDSGLPIVNEIEYLSQEIRFEYTGVDVDFMTGIYYQDWEESQPSETAFKVFNPQLNQYVVLTQAVGKALSAIKTYSGFVDATWHINTKADLFGGLRLTQEKGSLDYARRDLTVLDTPSCVTYTDTKATFTEDSAACTGPQFGGALPSGVFANQPTSFKRDDTIDDWSARVGGTWAFNDEVNMYVSASRSFVGLAFDVGRTASAETAILEPTSSAAYEIGVKSKLFDDTMSFNANIFVQNTKDLQLTATKPSSVDSIALNAGDIKARGLEMNISWQATNNLRLDFAGNYIDSEFGNLINSCYFGQSAADGCNIDNDNNGTPESQNLKGASAIQTPEISYSAGARYDIPMADIAPINAYIATAYTWQDEVQYTLFNDPETVQKAYGLLDVSAGISGLDDKWEASIFGKNVTDKVFFDGKSEGTGSLGRVYVRVPRGAQTYWGLRATYRF